MSEKSETPAAPLGDDPMNAHALYLDPYGARCSCGWESDEPIAGDAVTDFVAHATSGLRSQLEAAEGVVEAARAVRDEWLERGDGGCTIKLQLALNQSLVALEKSAAGEPGEGQ